MRPRTQADRTTALPYLLDLKPTIRGNRGRHRSTRQSLEDTGPAREIQWQSAARLQGPTCEMRSPKYTV